MSTRTSKLTEEAWSQHISNSSFDMFVTTKYPKLIRTQHRIEANLNSIRRHEKYLAFVSSKCFGKKALNNPARGFYFINFFEDLSKIGETTIFHAHTLVDTRGNYGRVEHYFKKEWEKIRPFRRSTPPVIKNIEDVTTLSYLGSYCSKFSHNEYEILANIPL